MAGRRDSDKRDAMHESTRRGGRGQSSLASSFLALFHHARIPYNVFAIYQGVQGKSSRGPYRARCMLSTASGHSQQHSCILVLARAGPSGTLVPE